MGEWPLANKPPANRRANGKSNTSNWIAARNAEVARRNSPEAAAAGHAALGRAARTGRAGVGGDLVESKFGLRAELSDNQKKANREFDNYRVDHALPQDVGVIVGSPVGTAAGKIAAGSGDERCRR